MHFLDTIDATHLIGMIAIPSIHGQHLFLWGIDETPTRPIFNVAHTVTPFYYKNSGRCHNKYLYALLTHE